MLFEFGSDFCTVCVTGGTGSLGQALTRYLLTHYPDIAIRVLSRGEHKQAEMADALGDGRVRYLIGDVRDHQRLVQAFENVDLVLHCAALKRQPTLEYNPYEAIATNVYGTQQVLRACADTGVKQCIFISSDKAVAPVTLYGQVKAVGEVVTIQANAYTPKGTRYNIVRWGNVAGSNGSVIPFWRQCLAQGKKLPVTDVTATRFWIDMSQAVETVLYVAQQPTRGMIYVPHIPAFFVCDLARALCPDTSEWSALPIDVVGLRPAEKVHEQLMTEAEQARAKWLLDDQLCYIVPPIARSWEAEDVPMCAATIPVSYSSDVWHERLNVEALRERLGGMA